MQLSTVQCTVDMCRVVLCNGLSYSTGQFKEWSVLCACSVFHRLVADLSIFYIYFHEHFFQDIRDIFLFV